MGLVLAASLKPSASACTVIVIWTPIANLPPPGASLVDARCAGGPMEAYGKHVTFPLLSPIGCPRVFPTEPNIVRHLMSGCSCSQSLIRGRSSLLRHQVY